MKKILAKAIYSVFGKSIEAERIQWDLNHEHLNKYGWYVNDQHELIVTR